MCSHTLLAAEPRARLLVIGSDPPPRHSLPEAQAIDLIGFVDDVREPLSRYSVFVCPILSGSGVRVKLLEAFAAGIPVVSTRIGAEGLARRTATSARSRMSPKRSRPRYWVSSVMPDTRPPWQDVRGKT